jgi:hypothetical protein
MSYNEDCNIEKKDFKMRDMNLLDHIKEIIELSEIEGMTDTFLAEAKSSLDYVCRKTKLNRIEAVFFSHFLDSPDRAVTIYDIGKLLKLDKIETMKYLDIVKTLEKKRYLCRNRDSRYHKENQLLYIIPLDIQKMVSNNNFSITKKNGLTTDEFFNLVQTAFTKCSNGELELTEYENEIISLVNCNKKLPFLKDILKHELGDFDMVFFISLCYIYLDNEENEFTEKDIECLYSNGNYAYWRKLRISLNKMTHYLFSLKILECVNKNGFGDTISFCFSQEMLNTLNQELDIKTDKKGNKKGLMLFEDIEDKPMYYNEQESKKLEDLFSLLNEDNFKQIQGRLSENGMRTGFACLFSGTAGTGKTETVYQIAKKTGRDIMFVDISETKSKWFSESEKLTKAIFSKYKKFVEQNEKAPILFFNEADAIFSKRRQLDDTRSSPGQTENAIQNIILQEMENLKGILICTTNLTKNFDKAFERRFLYKIEFEKPSADVRHKIWKGMIPDLSNEETEKLSSSFDLSGGQIENVARKRSIDIVLKGKPSALEAMIEMCKDEVLDKENSRPIGFGK